MAVKKKKKAKRSSSTRGRRRKPFKLKLKKETIHTFASVLLFLLAGLIMLSFSKQGYFLAWLFDFLATWFGWGMLFLPFFLISAGMMLSRLRWQICRPNVFVGSLVLLFSFISLTRSGRIGVVVWDRLSFLITGLGAVMVFFGGLIVGFAVMFNTSLEEIFLFVQSVASFFGKLFSFGKQKGKRPKSQKSRLLLGLKTGAEVKKKERK
ncbi:hypothetical protein MUP65_02090, partial [Patescibacteria group bacterium]|nr:hypothetical protein [Patescibacteria group bacterium]